MAKLRRKLILDKRLHAGASAPRQYLTGIDILHSHVGVPLIYIYKKGFDPAVAERGLIETLKHYPLVAGRIKKDAQGHVYIDGNDAGIDFQVWRCEGNMPPYGLNKPVAKDIKQFYAQLMMPWQVIDKDTPFLQIRIHQYADGGILMSVRMIHSIFDGTSYYGFMANWSKACLGVAFTPPSFDRSVLIKAGQTDADTTGFEQFYHPPIGKALSIAVRLGWRAVTDMETAVFRIPAQVIQNWKDQAKAVLPENARISAGKLIGAYVLKTLSPLMPPGVPRSVGMAMDMRFISGLPVPRDYFGNALCYTKITYSEQALAHESLFTLAERCSPPAEQISAPAVTQLLTVAEQYRQKFALWKLMFRPAVDTLGASIVLNNLSTHPVYEVDLGGGKPDWYETWGMPNRMMALQSTPTKDGGIDLHMAACRAEMKALRNQLIADGIISAS